jgi:putative resolvase
VVIELQTGCGWWQTDRGRFGILRPPRGIAQRVGECGETGVDRLIVEHPDRLARCGVGLIEHLLHGCGVMVVDTGKGEDESAVAELVCDVIAIVTTRGVEL